MALITFNYKDILGNDLENAVCRLTPTQPTTTATEVRLNAPLYVMDGEVLDLPAGTYTVKLSGSNSNINGYLTVTSVDANLAELLNIVVTPSDIPQSLPISAVSGLQAELNNKLNVTDPMLGRLLTVAERNKLTSVQVGATVNQSDAFLLSRDNHTGTQPVSSITGLSDILATKLTSADLVGINSSITSLQLNQFTSAERTKLNGIAVGATQNAADSYLLSRVNHTGTQAISTITGLQTTLDTKLTSADLAGLNSSVTALQTNQFTSDERLKLTGIQAQATKNQTDAYLLDRVNHTGVQPQSSITNLTNDLAGINLALSGKANTSDLTPINSSITTLQNNQITTAERNKLTGIQSGATANQTDAYLLNRANHTGTQPQSSITNLLTDLANRPVVNSDTTFNVLGANVLSSNSYQLGYDLKISPVASSASIIQCWWGIRLAGLGGNIDYQPPLDTEAQYCGVMVKSGGSSATSGASASHTSLYVKQASWQNTSSALRIGDSSGGEVLNINYLGMMRLKAYTLATLPAASSSNNGYLALVTDATSKLKYSNGTAWLDV